MRISRIEILGRHAAAGEPVDEELRPIGARGRSGKSFEIGLQIVGIVRQSVEIGLGERQLSRVFGRLDAERPRSLILYGDFLLRGGELHRKSEVTIFPAPTCAGFCSASKPKAFAVTV